MFGLVIMFQLFYINSSCAFDTFIVIWTLKILRYTGWKRYLKIIYGFWNKDSGDVLGKLRNVR